MNVVMIAKCRLVHSLVTAASGRVYVYVKKKTSFVALDRRSRGTKDEEKPRLKQNTILKNIHIKTMGDGSRDPKRQSLFDLSP